VLREGSGVVADAMVEVLFAPRAGRELRENWRGIMSSAPREGVAAALRAMAARADYRPLLGSVRVPTLVVVGEDDAVTPAVTARSIHQTVAGSRFEVVPGAGHMTPVEQPRHFVRVLSDFLDSLA
jgi:pimeloyl-ACP methyl ester carboxylesterase